MIRILINRLIDWLVTLSIVIIIIWFVLTQPIFVIRTSQDTLPLIDKDKLRNHVIKLVENYSPRTIEYGNLNITAHYIFDELKAFGYVSYQSYTTLGGRYSNVVLELGPDTQEIIVIGAHYDAESNSLDIEGNASGVASLIELARQLSNNHHRLTTKVQIVAYPLSQDDSGSLENMGSYNHASYLKQSNKEVRLMISLDSVGHFNESKKSQEYPFKFMHLLYPDKGNYISLVGQLQDFREIRRLKLSFKKASDLPLYSFNTPNGFFSSRSSDHLNYQRHGFPAVLLTDTANYRKIASEGVINELDFDKMAMLVSGLYQMVMDSSNVDGNTTPIVDQKPLSSAKKAYDLTQNSEKLGGVYQYTPPSFSSF